MQFAELNAGEKVLNMRQKILYTRIIAGTVKDKHKEPGKV
jgi:hypothetical protein